MQRLSNKSRDTLYESVHEEVVKARIEVGKLNIVDKYIQKQLDNILFNLNCSAPQKALDCFEYNKER